MATQRVVLTHEDFAQLPNDGRRYEIHDGELSVTSLGEVFLSPLDVILSNTTVVQPDRVTRGADPVTLPPFPDLSFVPESLWP